MDFSLRRIEDENLYYYESEADSSIQLIFVPGSFNPELWRHQLRYFSRQFTTISFQPTHSFRHVKGEKNGLKNILDQDHIDNAVLIGNAVSNPVLQEFESRDDVVATVLTGAPKGKPKLLSKNFYNAVKGIGMRHPKLLKKMFFSEYTNYRVVKEFMREIDVASYDEFQGFIENYSIRRPSKPCMIVHPEDDRFSSLEFAKELKQECSLSVIRRAGTFCFYEKPQEYNKALNDFIQGVEENVRKSEVVEAKQQNRSLWDYQDNDDKDKEVERKLKVKR